MKKIKSSLIQLSFSFILVSLLISCGGNSSNDGLSTNNSFTKDSIELEKSKLELEKQKIQLEKDKVEKDKQDLNEKVDNEEAIRLAKKAQSFNVSPEGIIVAAKTYFYTSPDYETKKNAYLMKGDLVSVLRVSNNFLYIEFYSAYLNKTTKGWIDVKDVEHFDNY
jgi:hypothetical protein